MESPSEKRPEQSRDSNRTFVLAFVFSGVIFVVGALALTFSTLGCRNVSGVNQAFYFWIIVCLACVTLAVFPRTRDGVKLNPRLSVGRMVAFEVLGLVIAFVLLIVACG